MGFSDRILGKKNVNGGPHIESVSPVLALAGGEVRIAGSGLRPQQWQRPRVQFGEVEGGIVISSDTFLVARVPEGATSGPVVVASDGHVSNAHTVKVAVPIAENLHPVTNPCLLYTSEIRIAGENYSRSLPQKEFWLRRARSAKIRPPRENNCAGEFCQSSRGADQACRTRNREPRRECRSAGGAHRSDLRPIRLRPEARRWWWSPPGFAP